MSERQAYPRPERTPDNAPFLDGWREGRLVLPRCVACGEVFFYPRAACPHCWSDGIDWINASGDGTVVSYSLVHRPNHESFFDEAPIVLVELALDEGVTMLARVLCDPARASSGMRVALVTDPAAWARHPLPVFEPA